MQFSKTIIDIPNLKILLRIHFCQFFTDVPSERSFLKTEMHFEERNIPCQENEHDDGTMMTKSGY